MGNAMLCVSWQRLSLLNAVIRSGLPSIARRDQTNLATAVVDLVGTRGSGIAPARGAMTRLTSFTQDRIAADPQVLSRKRWRTAGLLGSNRRGSWPYVSD
jgi:hypothetical protein